MTYYKTQTKILNNEAHLMDTILASANLKNIEQDIFIVQEVGVVQLNWT